MKKMILTAFAALLFAAPAVQAQKVNKAALLAKIEKSNADITDPKKAEKASTWINRGKVFYEAAFDPTKDIFVSMPIATMKLAVGEPTSTSETKIGDGVACTAMVYPYFVVYAKDDKILAWTQTEEVLPGAAMKAIQAYNKAYELDPKTAEKVKEGLKAVSDFCSQAGNVGLDTGRFVDAADAYMTAYTAQSSPAYGKADPSLLYYAGYLRTVDGATNPESFVKGALYLQQAIDEGYADEKGDVYYYLFHSYYGQKEKNADALTKAKDALLTGISKFPKNERILDGLMQLYTSEEGVGDPADLVKMIDDAIAANPQNVDLWFGRGRIFYAMKDYDQSIESFNHVVELKPDLFEGNYYLGLFYIIKGDAMNTALNEKPYSSQTAYDNDLKGINEVYRQAIPWLEKAHALKADDFSTVEYLKQLCYRFRDEEGMSDRYDKYDALFRKMKGE